MIRSRTFHLLLTLSVLLGLCFPSVEAADTPSDFQKDIQPLLTTYCLKCHTGEKAKGDTDLAAFTDVPSIQKNPKLWQTALDQLNERTMPPDKKPQPTPEERQRIIDFIQHALTSHDPTTTVKDPGRVTIRRLNRAEYNNTIRDLFAVHTNPADQFPADGSGGGGFDNNADTLFIPPILMEQYFEAATQVLNDAPDKTLFIAQPGDALPKRDAAKKILEHFAFRAFRRPVKEEETAKLLKLFDHADARGDSFEKSIKLALKAILVSPQFLFRVEQDQPTSDPYPVSDYELATRLSYFLWASMPDDELFNLAKEKKLHDPAVLETQVRRMVKDEKFRAFAENFGGQWLGFRTLLTTAQPDRERFPQYTAALRDNMFEEAVLFIDSVFRDDAPITTLIDADYTFVNDRLARHYDIKSRVGGHEGEGMRRIKLDNPNRGGVLTLGATLVTTSFPLRTSPVLRGRWVLDEILGSPPPPPPPDAGTLPEDDKQTDGLTFRQRLELHRSKPECASCHARMDPLGFGLENFDPVGRWRTTQADKPIDAIGTLTTGETFKTPAELKKILATRKDAFARALTEKVLAYALGRGVEHYDHPTLTDITKTLSTSNLKSQTLLIEIARSYPFRHRRN